MSRQSLASLAVVLVGLMSASSFAQIVYAPIQYQYGSQDHFYYGGSDPNVIARAAEPISAGGTYGRINGFSFVSGDVTTHREVSSTEPARIYSDALPLQNARVYGYTISDAYNDANANAPRYFRKADLLRAAEPSSTGGWVVPAQAQPIPGPRIYTTPSTNTTAPSLRPTNGPKPLLIIPKDQLQRLQNQPPTKVASNER